MIALSDIVDHVNGHSRPIYCGEQLLMGNYLVKYGWQVQNEDTVLKVLGLCLQTSDAKAAPHEIEVELLLLNGSEANCTIIKAVSCTCKAGRPGRCKHSVSLLLALSKLPDISQIPLWSVTDGRCQWTKENKRVVEEMMAPVQLDNFCHFKRPRFEVPVITPENLLAEREILLHGFPNSEFVQYLKTRGTTTIIEQPSRNIDLDIDIFNLPLLDRHAVEDLMILSSQAQTEIDFYYEFVDTSAEMSKIIFGETISQNNNIWRKHRQIRITGSVCHSLLTYSKNKKPN